MALTNDSYIVSTATAGDIIVPIKEAVPYLNVQLIGYQHYSYHSLMSQNLANIVDDIKALQDGGLAQVTFDLDALVAQAQADIDAQILGLESGINDKIIFQTDEAVSNTNTQLAAFNDTLNGDGVTTFGIVGDVNDVVALVGDANSGLTKRVDTIETAVGDETSGGLVQQFNGISSIVTDLGIVVGSETSGLVEDVLIIQDQLGNISTGLIPRMTSLEVTIGDSGSGLFQQVQTHDDVIYGDGTYAGLYNIVGNNTAGAIKDIEDNRLAIVALDGNLTPRTTSIENALGHLTNTGITADVAELQTQQATIRTNLGDTDASGLRLRVSNIEALNVQGIRDQIYGDGLLIPGLVSDTTGLRADVDAILTYTSSGDNEAAIAAVDAKADANAANIVTINTDLATKTTQISTINDNLNNVTTGINTQLANIGTTIQNTVLTYDDGLGTVVTFTPNVLYAIKTNSDNLTTSDIINQFQTYFGTPGSYILPSEVGKAALDTWIADVANPTGYKLSTEVIIANYLTANYTMSNIAANTAAIATLNGLVGTPGSVLHSIDTELTAYDETLNGPTGSITILNSDIATPGSVAYTTNAAITAYDTQLQASTIADLQGQINTLSTTDDTIRTEIKNTTSELQVEMVRYDTILPFLQQMFKYVNQTGAITDSEIDTLFTTALGKVEAMSATIINQDYVIYFTDNGGGGLNTFDMSIILDRDLKFTPLADEQTTLYIRLRRISDGYINFGNLDGTTLDAANNLVVDSGIYLESTEARLYADGADVTGVEILSLADPIVCEFATLDIFGQYKLHTVPVVARP